MKPKTIALAAACSLCAIASHYAAAAEREWTIAARTVPMAGSGIFHAWLVLDAVSGVERRRFVVTYFGKEDPVPEIGQTCLIESHAEDIEGVIGHQGGQLAAANVIDSIRCKN
ncbi:hypothetical protein J5226_17770 [Lysobacter sp. K5869]|uniref:hypothetical protein n=1 Tax=Lysobacter sp. K5869 TaxID=2820808 RepID=UPI001C05FC52|nr:hypothetical protein [Lysobacter sp. K5869]QWP75451.1 hypothetical protein J5226_17770 [Lysobacter sp. K5869]